MKQLSMLFTMCGEHEFLTGDILMSSNRFQDVESALRHLILSDIPKRLWVDAICIDQRNFQNIKYRIRDSSMVEPHRLFSGCAKPFP